MCLRITNKLRESCFELKLIGTVQGVGFRPFVYKIAVEHNLKGWAKNTNYGLLIVVQGAISSIEAFKKKLISEAPTLAKIKEIEARQIEVKQVADFQILTSDAKGERKALIPPDIAICKACVKDLLSKESRFYQYPFTNCTNCGPRFTIVEKLPYDRKQTSMKEFPMCADCALEYNTMSNRRFHAQPIACNKCGPEVELRDKDGNILQENWLPKTWQLLKDGKIIAVKGLGGFHLICKVEYSIIDRLRRLKGRESKPLAVMCRDLSVVKHFCVATKEEQDLLTSPIAPIVVLPIKNNDSLPSNLTQGLPTLGVMLPYSPLHLLLLQGSENILIATSGNISSLPLIKDNEQALTKLQKIADYFLLHNRKIVGRCDDSLVVVVDKKPQIWRRSRGYVPQPITLPIHSKFVILGAGAEIKNTFCLLNGNNGYISQHIGDLETVETQQAYIEALNNYKKLLELEPSVVAVDMHPGYNISKLARFLRISKEIPVQHHHAHFISCLGENNYYGSAIGCILDGTGYGEDAAFWGFELIQGDYKEFTRLAHLEYVPLPGADIAIYNPWRIAVAYLVYFLKEKGKKIAKEIFKSYNSELELVMWQVEHKFNAPLTGGCGRLFDAVAAFLGICHKNSYEGQAAVMLSHSAWKVLKTGMVNESYYLPLENRKWQPAVLWEQLCKDYFNGVDIHIIAAKFHRTIGEAVVTAAVKACHKSGLERVALSGGVWQNAFLSSYVTQKLKQEGLKVLQHRLVPPNDGGLCLGQALIAAERG